MYVPIHFIPQELLPKAVWNAHGAKGWAFMDDRILWTLDSLRAVLKRPITVNTWYLGGQFEQRGFRMDMSVGAVYSQHRFGRAVDFDISGRTAADFRNMVTSGLFKTELQYITRIEDEVAWVHIDCAGLPRQPGDQIIFFKP